MLKIRRPIKTALRDDFLGQSEAFCERITGNYAQMASYIGEADLLHVVTEPPEIFVMDGGMTSLLSETNLENTQINKTKIINNLINRILLSADGHLSYQDNVYITNILHRLGIKDEKTFMREVDRLARESREQHETIRLYWDNLRELRTMVSEYESETRETRHTETATEGQPVLHLHEEVNNRLQTAAIYRILQNFYESGESPRSISNELIRISEQSRLSREMLLTRLRETVKGEPVYLQYRHENIYEGDEITENGLTVEEVTSRVTSAVLLNLIDNIYDTTIDRIDRRVSNWISTEATYYGAAENTLYRMEQNTAYLQYLYEQAVNDTDIVNEYSSELNTIKSLLELRESLAVSSTVNIAGNEYDTDIENDYSRGGDNISVTEYDVEGAELIHITNEGDTDTVTDMSSHTDSLTEEVINAYQQSIVRNQQYMNALQNIIEQNTVSSTPQSTAERMRRESRLSLEAPEQFMREYREAEDEAAERADVIIRESEKLLSPIQQEAHTLIREYLRAPERFYMSERISADNMGLMLWDIREAERSAYAAERDADSETASRGDLSGSIVTDAGAAPAGENTAATNRVFETAVRVLETGEHIEREFTDIRDRVANVTDERMVFRREGDIVSRITERVIERFIERRERPSGAAVEYEDIHTDMVHRNRETVISEEVIESMQMQLRELQLRRDTTERSVTENLERTSTVINDTTHETIEQNTEEITRIVNSSVRRQIDEISDRVYGRIERQLKNEQRRRGL